MERAGFYADPVHAEGDCLNRARLHPKTNWQLEKALNVAAGSFGSLAAGKKLRVKKDAGHGPKDPKGSNSLVPLHVDGEGGDRQPCPLLPVPPACLGPAPAACGPPQNTVPANSQSFSK